MKKSLRFLYRYFTTSRRWRRWINHQNLLIVLISVTFLTILSWTAPMDIAEGQHTDDALPASAAIAAAAAAAQEAQQETPAPTADARSTVTSTPLPPEFLANANQTIGITLAGTALVLIVIFGVLKFMPGKEKS